MFKYQGSCSRAVESSPAVGISNKMAGFSVHALSHTSSCCPQGKESGPEFKNEVFFFPFKSERGAERTESGKSEKQLIKPEKKQFGAVAAVLEAKEFVEEKLATSLSHTCPRFLARISLKVVLWKTWPQRC